MDISRRRLFTKALNRTGLVAGEDRQKLPWERDDITFTDQCTRCGKCAEHCETQIIVNGDGGFPSLDFKKGECTFCYACAEKCPEPLFYEETQNPWNQTAGISECCLAFSGVECRSCGDSCETRAIRFQLSAGAVAHPIINPKDCSGCGACIAPCPVSAIKMENSNE
ncbi:ferredoxin-type protein NapF [Parasalinivibrio latis]|uniref:ferredoxin-type protein NapF n=1 Tax=Parasalinivibrio latis TaxID=2952610 RepID=UPI0030E4F175